MASANILDTESERLLGAVLGLLETKGILTADEIAERVEITDSASPGQGARMVAKAWLDPAYRARMIQDGSKAAEEIGIPMRGMPPLGVLENTAAQHNLVVCTLCSCYPWPVLGLPPAWYKSAPYRSRAVIDPRGVMREFGLELGEDIEIRVWDSTAEIRYLVLPERPAGTAGWSEERLAGLVTRDAMIGVTKALSP